MSYNKLMSIVRQTINEMTLIAERAIKEHGKEVPEGILLNFNGLDFQPYIVIYDISKEVLDIEQVLLDKENRIRISLEGKKVVYLDDLVPSERMSAILEIVYSIEENKRI